MNYCNTEKKRLSIYIDCEDYELLLYRANEQCRSLNSFISFLLKISNAEYKVDNDILIKSKYLLCEVIL